MALPTRRCRDSANALLTDSRQARGVCTPRSSPRAWLCTFVARAYDASVMPRMLRLFWGCDSSVWCMCACTLKYAGGVQHCFFRLAQLGRLAIPGTSALPRKIRTINTAPAQHSGCADLHTRLSFAVSLMVRSGFDSFVRLVLYCHGGRWASQINLKNRSRA